eukprot:1770615-Alexandrium_andersonii.AAC.1
MQWVVTRAAPTRGEERGRGASAQQAGVRGSPGLMQTAASQGKTTPCAGQHLPSERPLARGAAGSRRNKTK